MTFYQPEQNLRSMEDSLTSLSSWRYHRQAGILKRNFRFRFVNHQSILIPESIWADQRFKWGFCSSTVKHRHTTLGKSISQSLKNRVSYLIPIFPIPSSHWINFEDSLVEHEFDQKEPVIFHFHLDDSTSLPRDMQKAKPGNGKKAYLPLIMWNGTSTKAKRSTGNGTDDLEAKPLKSFLTSSSGMKQQVQIVRTT